MGLFNVKGDSLEKIGSQVWYPQMKKTGVQYNVFTKPGMKKSFDELSQRAGGDVRVFSTNRDIKGEIARVSAERFGLVAQTDERTFEVHVPVQQKLGDIATMAIREVQIGKREDISSVGEMGKWAVAKAIDYEINGTYLGER